MPSRKIVLTPRDREVIKLVASYGILTSKQISTQVFASTRLTTVLRRLRRLEDAGYIEQTVATASFDRCWYVTRKTRLELDVPMAKVNFPKAYIDHDLKLAALRLKLEGLGMARSWIPEHDIRSKVVTRHGLRNSKRRVIPDGIMGVDRGTKESVAIELELSIKNQRRYREIFEDYMNKSNLWAVWYLVPNQTMARQIMKARKGLYFGNAGPRLLISEIGDVMQNGGNAKIADLQRTYRLEEVWSAMQEPKPAHPGAQQVSAQAQEKCKGKGDVTTGSERQTLFPTG